MGLGEALSAVPVILRLRAHLETGEVGDVGAAFAADHVAAIIADEAIFVPRAATLHL